jgi:hypothetical protein
VDLGVLHRSIDLFAIWTEDLYRHSPEAARLALPEPLACFGALPALPDDAPTRGRWSTPSPLPTARGDDLVVHATPARGARRGTVLLVPPWKIGRLTLVQRWVDLHAERGYDVWLVCPPCHLERTPPGARSGERFVSLDLGRLRGTFAQLVAELRLLVALAAARGRVGLVGLSLGALAGALAATAAEPLDFAVLVAPPELSRVLAETGIGRLYRRLCGLAGEPWPDDGALAAALAPLDPALRAPTARRVLVAAALHDRVVPFAAPLRLARAWDVEPRVYRRGHMTLLFTCRALRRDVARFVADA